MLNPTLRADKSDCPRCKVTESKEKNNFFSVKIYFYCIKILFLVVKNYFHVAEIIKIRDQWKFSPWRTKLFSKENQTFLQAGDKKRVADILNTIR